MRYADRCPAGDPAPHRVIPSLTPLVSRAAWVYFQLRVESHRNDRGMIARSSLSLLSNGIVKLSPVITSRT